MTRAANAVQAILLLGVLAACGTGGDAPGPEPSDGVSPTSTALATSAPIDAKILFLHHSTGEAIWEAGVPAWFTNFNAQRGTEYQIAERVFPESEPYGWNNYPYDYWNIWVRNAGPSAFRNEPTLEILTAQYDVIVWKHCFPVSNVKADTGDPDVASSEKRLENYRLQYQALKEKMRSFSATRFVVWTSAALIESATSKAEAERSREFVDWVRTRWDERGDNIFVWDFWQLETEGGLFMMPGNASGDSHPNESFAKRVAPQFAQRVVDVVEGRGDG